MISQTNKKLNVMNLVIGHENVKKQNSLTNSETES